MQTVRPSILQRGVKAQSRAGQETADDAWVKEERRLEARRARVAGYEQQFRVSHTYDATPQERSERIVQLRRAHDMLHDSHVAVQDRDKEMDRQFAINQINMARQAAAEEDARAAAKKRAEVEAGRMNREIAEARRTARVVNRRKENASDNEMIQQALSAKRTFLY